MANLKIKPEHLEHLREKISEVLDNNPTAVKDYESGNFPRSEQVKDLQKRFCFDMLYASVSSKWVCDNLCPYLDDRHIYSALKAVCPSVTRKY
jgi:hypothetical protein